MTSERRLRIRRRGNAACSQRTPGLPLCTYATIALALPFQAPGLTVSGLSFYGPDSELQLDIRAINIRFIYESSRRGVWTIFSFLCAQGVDCVLPVKGAVMSVGRRRNPQHFPVQPQALCRFYTSHPQVRTQPRQKPLRDRIWKPFAHSGDHALTRPGEPVAARSPAPVRSPGARLPVLGSGAAAPYRPL